MARKSTITAEAVAQAIEVIQARGDRVTLALIRQQLGGGSFSTISPFYQKWEQAQAESASLAEVEVPDRLAVAGEEWLAKVWRIAVDAASAGHEALRRELVEARETIDQVKAEGAEMVAIVEAERDQAQEEVEAAVSRAAVLQGEIDEQRRVVARIEAENARLVERVEARSAEALAAREQVERASEREFDMRQARDEARAEAARARDDLAHARKQLDEKSLKLEGVQSDLGAARAELATERAQHAATKENLTERFDRLRVDLEASKEALAAAKASKEALAAANDEVQVLRGERDDARATHADLVARLDRSENLLATAQKEKGVKEKG